MEGDRARYLLLLASPAAVIIALIKNQGIVSVNAERADREKTKKQQQKNNC
jgi:hypothetical protein